MMSVNCGFEMTWPGGLAPVLGLVLLVGRNALAWTWLARHAGGATTRA